MDNPCKECNKMKFEWLYPFEYGCGTPCQKAKDYYKSIEENFDKLIARIKE